MIVEPVILVNLFITLVSVWIAMLVNAKFLRPAKLNEKRFMLYQLRDRLALLAMSGLLEEKSEEYVTLLRLINKNIESTKEFRVTKFLHVQAQIITDERLRNHLQSILAKIKNDSMPSQYQKVVFEFFQVARGIYEHKTWLLRHMINPLILLLTGLSFVVRVAGRLKDVLVSQRDRIESIDTELEKNMAGFRVA